MGSEMCIRDRTCSMTAPATCPNLFGGNLLGSEGSLSRGGWNLHYVHTGEGDASGRAE